MTLGSRSADCRLRCSSSTSAECAVLSLPSHTIWGSLYLKLGALNWRLSSKDELILLINLFHFLLHLCSSSSHSVKSSVIFLISFWLKRVVKVPNWRSRNFPFSVSDSRQGSKLYQGFLSFSPINASFISLIAGPRHLTVPPTPWPKEEKELAGNGSARKSTPRTGQQLQSGGGGGRTLGRCWFSRSWRSASCVGSGSACGHPAPFLSSQARGAHRHAHKVAQHKVAHRVRPGHLTQPEADCGQGHVCTVGAHLLAGQPRQ